MKGLVVACLGLALVACTLNFDEVGPQPTGGEAPSACDGRCTSLPPGFEGVARVVRKACQGTVRFEGGELGGKVTAPPAKCGCQCVPPATLGCGKVNLSLFGSPACADEGNLEMFNEGMCTSVNGSLSAELPGDTGEPVSGSCGSDGAAAELPPLQFESPLIACDEEPSTCALANDGTGFCLTGSSGFCFYGPGALACPEGLTELALVRPQDFEDTRDCTCECGELQGNCESAVDLFDNADCEGNPLEQFSAGVGCVYTNEQFLAVRYRPVPSNGCFASPETPVGEASQVSFTRLCCDGLAQ